MRTGRFPNKLKCCNLQGIFLKHIVHSQIMCRKKKWFTFWSVGGLTTPALVKWNILSPLFHDSSLHWHAAAVIPCACQGRVTMQARAPVKQQSPQRLCLPVPITRQSLDKSSLISCSSEQHQWFLPPIAQGETPQLPPTVFFNNFIYLEIVQTLKEEHKTFLASGMPNLQAAGSEDGNILLTMCSALHAFPMCFLQDTGKSFIWASRVTLIFLALSCHGLPTPCTPSVTSGYWLPDSPSTSFISDTHYMQHPTTP